MWKIKNLLLSVIRFMRFWKIENYLGWLATRKWRRNWKTLHSPAWLYPIFITVLLLVSFSIFVLRKKTEFVGWLFLNRDLRWTMKLACFKKVKNKTSNICSKTNTGSIERFWGGLIVKTINNIRWSIIRTTI